jgi:beta-carotene/zeaxanthin 4-ketolase
MTTISRPSRSASLPLHQSVIGLGLATLIISAWLAVHVYGVFFHRWMLSDVVLAPVLVALQCWLSVGLFIVAHDGMHGSLAPHHPILNRAIGRLCLTVYAGFSYDKLLSSHHGHHRHPGTELDPDFYADDPEHFWRWYAVFFRRYFGWRPLLTVMAVTVVYWGLLGAGLANILVLWAAPALLSSLQLFCFGTYLPHRHEDEGFVDRHNARSSGYPWLLSLLTCFHFGHHHEHHVAPHVPWWKLPSTRVG